MTSSNPIFVSTAYLPPVQYISKFLLGDPVYIEAHENYQKQSYRNRCCVYGANGRQCLVIPVKKHHGEKTPIGNVEIDHKMPWQKIHLKSIESAYRLSPFYEFFIDEIVKIYSKKPVLLFEWNLELTRHILALTGIRTEVILTSGYARPVDSTRDFRQCIHPKKRLSVSDAHFNPLPYQQVFQERHGFLSNLSIIDLLFNEGPLAIEVLRKSII
jgi:hypothetical protein